jgi:hypothetical protein
MMGLTWYVLGLLTVASVVVLKDYSGRYRFDWIAWGGLVTGIFTVLFGIAWAVGSVLEGVPRAASMGILLFGIGGTVMVVLTTRYISTRLEKIQKRAPEAQAPVEMQAPKMAAVPSRLEERLWSVVRPLAWLSLLAAFAIGLAAPGADFETMVKERFPDRTLEKVNDDPVAFRLEGGDKGQPQYLVIEEGQGYGGPFVVGVRFGEDALVQEVMLLDHKETPAFILKTTEAGFGPQFVGKKVSDDFIVGVDVDAVSGATVSTMAGTQAIRKAAHAAALQYFKLEPTWKSVPWQIGLGEILILIIFVFAFIPRVYRDKPWKYFYMAATIGVVGFYLNASLSIGSFSGLIMGYIPGIKDHFIWWTLTVGTAAAVLILGKNVYCYRICPFQGVQFLLSRISGSRLSLPPALMKRSGLIANFLLWSALMIIFLKDHPALGAYEPFAMMFSLEGVGVQWFILPFSLLGAFFILNYWCRFFCPVGNCLNTAVRLRRKAVKRFSGNDGGQGETDE